jgi:hypothetical protein
VIPAQLHILQHSLGVDSHGRGNMYRNHFVTCEGTTDFPDCEALVAAGMMERRTHKIYSGNGYTYVVLPAGIEYVKAHSPPLLAWKPDEFDFDDGDEFPMEGRPNAVAIAWITSVLDSGLNDEARDRIINGESNVVTLEECERTRDPLPREDQFDGYEDGCEYWRKTGKAVKVRVMLYAQEEA